MKVMTTSPKNNFNRMILKSTLIHKSLDFSKIENKINYCNGKKQIITKKA